MIDRNLQKILQTPPKAPTKLKQSLPRRACHATAPSINPRTLDVPPILMLILMFTAQLISSIAHAEESPQSPLKVGLAVFEPMVVENRDQSFSGFDIDLWNAIAEENGWQTQMQALPFNRLIKDLESGSIDVALGGITINSEREKKIDFSHPYMDSGLRILVTSDSPLVSTSPYAVIFNKQVFIALLYLALFTIVCGHLIWFLEKGRDAFDDRYFPGILEGFWWCFVTMTTVGYGDFAPKRWLGRIIAVPVMFSGIVFFAWFIAQMQVALDLNESRIERPEDLRGLKVGTKAHTTSEDDIKEYGAKIMSFEDIHRAYLALTSNQIDAVVFDAPNILNFVKNDESKNFTIVGPLFKHQQYGIALKHGSYEIREKINQSILNMQKKGKLNELRVKWFGKEQGI